MKKFFAILLCLAMVLTLCACDSDEPTTSSSKKKKKKSTEPTVTTSDVTGPGSFFEDEDPDDTTAGGDLLVGYGKIEFTPQTSVTMAGYGEDYARKSAGILSYLHAQCVAISVEGGDTVLLISMDLYAVPQSLVSVVSDAVGIPEECIILTATGTPNSPVISEENSAYMSDVKYALSEIAQMAVEDLQPAQAYGATVMTDAMVFSNRYYAADGRIVDEFSAAGEGGLVSHETEADAALHLIKFDRQSGLPVVLANLAVQSEFGEVSQNINADFVGAFRTALEAEEYYGVFFSGASGDTSPRSRILEENIFAGHKEYGECLAEYVMEADYIPLEADEINIVTTECTVSINHTNDHMLQAAQTILDGWRNGTTKTACAQVGADYGIPSVEAASNIKSCAAMGATVDLKLSVISLGDIAFASVPYQMFSVSGRFIKENSPYDMTFILSQGAGLDFAPTELAFENAGGASFAVYAPGSAEVLAETYVEMLEELYG